MQLTSQVRGRIKKVLAHLPIPAETASQASALLRLGRWYRANGCADLPDHRRNRALYEWIQNNELGNEPITYLEFGVRGGSTITKWTETNHHPNSTFTGFDTFTGLPEDWETGLRATKKGTFSMDGRIPDIKDPRVEFVQGLFQDTLPGFMEKHGPPTSRVVVHLDADLYSSTLFALTRLDPWLREGSILVFDEFDSPLHEFRALIDWQSAYGREVRPIVKAGPFLRRLAVRVTA